MATDLAAAIAAIADRQAIAANLANHSRGIDRTDARLLKSVYHPDATVSYGMFDGPAADFADLIVGLIAGRPITLHRHCNMSIRVDGDRALSESYVIAYLDRSNEAAPVRSLVGGRYLDRHEKRDGLWRMSHRLYVLDWNINRPAAGAAAPDEGSPFRRGAQGADDPGARLLAAWRADMKGKDTAMEITGDLAAKAAAVLAKQDIHELIMAQARATDRGDEALLRSLWHPGATVDVGVFAGPADEFCGMIVGATAGLQGMSHSVANEWIDVAGDTAVAESYVIAFTRTREPDGWADNLTGGRYIDRFERRGGVWKYTHRTFVMDWVTSHPSTDQTGQGMYETLTTRGGKYPDDPLYAFWKGPA
ncbi:nuclear transport factor 2 family protein, partial [Mycolicibacterium sp.]|uniref:nuclear transport factor 2 family protein n=1 Tax=Mycolicibacterium sp. TaxID=2320850 RepID=UPI0035607B69